jgi:hypothetical protein
MPWSTRFEDPIVLPDGRTLTTFKGAASYIQKLPKKTRETEPWRLATRILIAAAEGRDFNLHARIAVAKALDLPKELRERRRARKYMIVS